MIVGGKLNYAEVKREKEEAASGISINVTIDAIDIKDGDLHVQYTYSVNYEKDVGHLKMSGIIIAREDNPERIAREWAEKKRLPDAFAEELLNAINFTCGVNGTLVVRALGLAPPMVLPRITLAKGEVEGKAA